MSRLVRTHGGRNRMDIPKVILFFFLVHHQWIVIPWFKLAFSLYSTFSLYFLILLPLYFLSQLSHSTFSLGFYATLLSYSIFSLCFFSTFLQYFLTLLSLYLTLYFLNPLSTFDSSIGMLHHMVVLCGTICPRLTSQGPNSGKLILLKERQSALNTSPRPCW